MKSFLCKIIFLFLLFYTVPAYALTSGTTTTGSISAGGTSSQSFTGTAGQGVVLYANASYDVVISVYKPDGSYWSFGTNRFSATLPATGTYNVVLSGRNSTDSGTYSLAYVRGSDSVSNGSLSSGQSYNGTLSTNGIESFQLTGTSGQGIFLYANASYDATISIYKPDGSYWSSGTNRLSGALPATGTYTVVVTGNNKPNSGAYRLDYVRGSDNVSNGILTSGQSYNGTLATNGLESFQFTGTSGQSIVLYASASYTAVISVYKPDGSYWSSGSSRLSGALPATGTYTVVVSGYNYTNNGAYRLDYVRGSDSVSNGILTSGQSYNGTLATNGLESFQFTGTSGQSIVLHADASYTAVISVYKPDGSYWSSGSSRLSGALPATGTYTVLVNGYNYTNNGAYRLDYMRGSGSVSDGMLVSASQRAGALQTNGLESYKFSGVVGGSLSVTSTASYTRTLQVYKPDGSYWTYGNNSLSATLPVAGEYTLVFTGYNLGSNGDYTITLTTPPAPVAASTPSKVGAETMSCPQGEKNTVANPINFDVGFKKQTEVDYDTGGLVFSRIYRSDSTWTDNTIGALWRHNYARTLTVGVSTAEITDGTGATTHYTLSGGAWVPDDPDTTATFKTVGSEYSIPCRITRSKNTTARSN
jgi:hypothetical protein